MELIKELSFTSEYFLKAFYLNTNFGCFYGLFFIILNKTIGYSISKL